MVKANFDRAIFTLEHRSGIGVVLRDDQGSVLASLSQLVSQVYNPLEIEALAAAAALRFALDLGFSQVVLEGDSQVLMEDLINDYKFLSSEGLLMDDTRTFARFFSQLRYSHVNRKCNKVVYRLARHALSISNFVIWMEDVLPPFISAVLANNNIAGFS